MKKPFKKYIPWIILLLIILSLSLLYIFSTRVTQEQTKTYETKLQEAQTYLEARQYSMAISSYFDAVETVPKRLDAYEGVIEILLIKNRVDEAQEVIEESGKPLSYTDKSVLYQMIGDYYFENDNYSKAHDMYDNGLILGVRNSSLELMYAKVLIKLGDINEANKYLQKNVFTQEEQIEVNLLLSYIYALEDRDQAQQFLQLIEPSGDLGIYYDEFLEVLKDLDDDEKFNATKLARVYINNGYPYLAISILNPLKEEIPEYLEGMYFLGRAYFDYGDYEEAIETLNVASGLVGMEEEIFWTKARAYYLVNDLENMVRDYDNALASMSEDINEILVREYIDVLLEINRKLKAEEVMRSLIFKDLENPFLNLIALYVNYDLNETLKVDYYISQLEKLELRNDQQKEYLEWKITISLEKNEIENIQANFDLLYDIDKFNPKYHFLLGKYQIKTEELELAKQSLERTLEYDLNYEFTEDALKMLSSLR